MAVSEDQNQQETNHSVDEGELEQYGVWVKAGPEDVIEAEAEDQAFSLDDLSEESLEGGTESVGDESAGIGDELEEIELDNLEIESEPQPGADPAEFAVSGAGTPAQDDDDLVELTLDELDTESEDDGLETLDLEIDDLTPDETSTDNFAEDDSDLLTLESDDLTIDLAADTEEAEVAEELELDPAPGEAAEESGSGDGLLDDDLSIDEDLPDDLDDLKLDLDTLDVDSFEETPAPAEPEQAPDDLITLDDDVLGTPEEVDELDLSTLPAEDDGFGEISADELTQAEESDLPELDGDEDILDLDSLGADVEPDDLSVAPVEVSAETDSPDQPAAAAGDGSHGVLESIERELSSIRSELGDLKRELGELRGGKPAAPATEVEPEDAGGFFTDSEEDDDETIALTGAELDNIMNTAEITEETGRPTEIDDIIPAGDAPILDELIPEAPQSTSPVTEISLEEPAQESEPLEIDLDGSDESALLGSEEEVEALASMDIDAELADIDELDDDSESAGEFSEEALPDLELDTEPLVTDADEPTLDVAELDTETLDLPEDIETLDVEPLDEIDLDDDQGGAAALEPDLALDTGVPSPPESDADLPDNLKTELKSVLSYMDQLLESLPEDKIQEFAQSDHFTVYRRLFEELGLEQ